MSIWTTLSRIGFAKDCAVPVKVSGALVESSGALSGVVHLRSKITTEATLVQLSGSLSSSVTALIRPKVSSSLVEPKGDISVAFDNVDLVSGKLTHPKGIVLGNITRTPRPVRKASAQLIQSKDKILSAVVSGKRAPTTSTTTGSLTQPSGKLLGVLYDAVITTGKLVHTKGSLSGVASITPKPKVYRTVTGNLVGSKGRLKGSTSTRSLVSSTINPTTWIRNG
ncbi:MAG: hypothetical protein KZQ66_12920 [Candidatus Thiodiazotropha sp. (ex Lucinoma aequizonata)]|nr:hypothetical protein [Candidatus Thiodiazotropha sp. (ex Lucinoma aequizonata)]MCU7888320.1 hypothetical protein [Candidatus Thiodiazotropha sp. (ex Lucinoma aequizonata)]MCU7898930.1 hypothetical protein [Candidatus Thiodiazotropha sp. (ex Lucinoma aequizonata)]MCU7902784.1 hypothetical protein [Candidatus Thiodiazotropha sp. (ex Lucinoma aequizonata)]MCU7909527.1 hypothetical protein [Candidatus Thiodiazotropha sp. (ex Lucinoma aequizonata)]